MARSSPLPLPCRWARSRVSDGIPGTVHASDVRVAEGIRDTALPADPGLATAIWNRTFNKAVVHWQHDRGADMSDLNELDAQGLKENLLPVLPALLRGADVHERLFLTLPSARNGGDADGALVADLLSRRRRAWEEAGAA